MSAAECCKDSTTVSKLSFLEGKAANFKKFVLGFSPDDEVKAYIDTFKPELLVQTITTVLLPIVQLGQVDSSVDELVKHLTVPASELDAVKTKLKAYLMMFNDVFLS
jgi:hypothetical protein